MPGPPRHRLVLALITAAVVAVLDQSTKAWAVDRLSAGPCGAGGTCIDVLFSLRFHLIHNPGAAFSTGRNLGQLFGVVALVMTFVLLRMAWRRTDRLGGFLLGLIAGGAFGNLIDRVLRAEDGPFSGKVVDFIDLQWWPVFNVADMAVVVGVLAFVAYSMFDPDTAAGTAPAADSPTGDGTSGDTPAGDGTSEGEEVGADGIADDGG